MAFRTRSRYSDPVIIGTRRTSKLGLVFKDSGVASSHYVYETCADFTMPRPYTADHSLGIEKTVVRPTIINGSYDHGSASPYGVESYQSYRYLPLSANASLYGFTAFDASYYKTLALANASPYQSKVNLPLFLFELREFPSMLRQIGRVLQKKTRPTDVAGGYLAYSFGWAPLVKDLLALLDLTKDIENRKAYFRRLERGTRVRRSLGTQQVRTTTQFSGTLLTAVHSKIAMKVSGRLEETQKVWYTLNAKLRNPLNMSAADLHSMSKREVLGLRINPADLWDAVPWSWLIDYFVNIGDMLEASRALVGMDVTRINIMCLSKIIVVAQPESVLAGLQVQPGFVYRTRKARYPFANAIPTPAFAPFLTMHQTGILGSLATVKALKAFGAK